MMEGFSFPCAPTVYPEATLESFFKADPQSVYNPYPLLARRKNFRQARTNPLVELQYWPTPMWALTDHANVLKEIYTCLEFVHELKHVHTIYTPAKRWAQYLEAGALLMVRELLDAEAWDTEATESWRFLRGKINILSAIATRICLSEELLVTAMSFGIIRFVASNFSEYAHWWGELDGLEEASIQYFEKEELRSLYPDFRTLYEGTIKKVIGWATQRDSSILSKLICTFLQGIHINGHPEDWTIDSHQQCLRLAKQVKRMSNPVQLSDWLNEMIDEESFLLGTDFREKLVEETRGTFLEALCHMTQPIPEEDAVANSKGIYCCIYPALLDTQLHIKLSRVYAVHASDDPYVTYIDHDVDVNVKGILKLEAILEQLIARDGICCPYYRIESEACLCTPEWKQSLLRILQWAREGKFGPGGTWRDLPPECSCGV